MYIYFHKNIFPQAYLIWEPKLDVPKIGILLSKLISLTLNVITERDPLKRFLSIFDQSFKCYRLVIKCVKSELKLKLNNVLSKLISWPIFTLTSPLFTNGYINILLTLSN